MTLPSPLQKIEETFLKKRDIHLFIKRDDLINSYVSGNKWRKLKYNIKEAKRLHQHTLLTFGGAHSNHIFSVAAAGKMFGYNTIGIIRGERNASLNDTLKFAQDSGMNLRFISREQYRLKEAGNFLAELKNKVGDFYVLPEGGTNLLAVKGCEEIISEIDIGYDLICCPCGTGGTLAGLITGLQGKEKVLGFSVLKGMVNLENSIEELVFDTCKQKFDNWSVNHNYHFGGYAKTNQTLISFIENFRLNHNVRLDPVYTGKMMYGIYDLIKKNSLPAPLTIIAVHTGGLRPLI
ncbi:MAG: 1-aminocyclopropane-1-carboxylate deaminase/D-cysteine desulfhydrase [Chitinophagales bacterium]|nr:1-aminocyclopropane-1-carboxylate deaminase/D-cysteine desulfhydrase [Chitinophagales bacterium]